MGNLIRNFHLLSNSHLQINNLWNKKASKLQRRISGKILHLSTHGLNRLHWQFHPLSPNAFLLVYYLSYRKQLHNTHISFIETRTVSKTAISIIDSNGDKFSHATADMIFLEKLKAQLINDRPFLIVLLHFILCRYFQNIATYFSNSIFHQNVPDDLKESGKKFR